MFGYSSLSWSFYDWDILVIEYILLTCKYYVNAILILYFATFMILGFSLF